LGADTEGITSADAKAGLIAVTDRTARQLVVLDASSRKRIASAKLATEPDYIRIVKSKNEIWVTQPSESRIEIFSLGEDRHPKHSAFIAVEGGPESLVIDDDHGRAFANTWKDETLAVDLNSRSIVSRWPNGCSGSRGLTFDPDDTRLFVGCKEGKLTVLDASSGKQLGSASSGDGVDIIAYDAKLKHAYLPGARSATMAVIAIEATGTTRVLETAHTAPGAHCVASDGQGKAFVCEPQKGRLLLFDDRALEAH